MLRNQASGYALDKSVSSGLVLTKQTTYLLDSNSSGGYLASPLLFSCKQLGQVESARLGILDTVISTCESQEISSIEFYSTLQTCITFWSGKKRQLPGCVLYLQQRIPSCVAITTVDVRRRAFNIPSIVCLENVTSIAILLSCVPDGSSVNVMLDTNCWLTRKTAQVG